MKVEYSDDKNDQTLSKKNCKEEVPQNSTSPVRKVIATKNPTNLDKIEEMAAIAREGFTPYRFVKNENLPVVKSLKDIVKRLASDTTAAISKGYNLYKVDGFDHQSKVNPKLSDKKLKELIEDTFNATKIVETEELDKDGNKVKKTRKLSEVFFLKIMKIVDNVFTLTTLKPDHEDAKELMNSSLLDIDKKIYGEGNLGESDEWKCGVIYKMLDNLEVGKGMTLPYINYNEKVDKPLSGKSKLPCIQRMNCKLSQYFSLLDETPDKNVVGITTTTNYLTCAASFFAFQVEFLGGVGSIHLHEAGGSKVITVVPPACKNQAFHVLQQLIEDAFEREKRLFEPCTEYDIECMSLHKTIFVTPKFFDDHYITHETFVLKAGHLVHFASDAGHVGFSLSSGWSGGKNILDGTFGYVREDKRQICKKQHVHIADTNRMDPTHRGKLKAACLEMSKMRDKVTDHEFANLKFKFVNKLVVEDEKASTFPCLICKQLFLNQRSLERHQKNGLTNKVGSCLKPPLYTCPECDVGKSRYRELEEHMRAHHEGAKIPSHEETTLVVRRRNNEEAKKSRKRKQPDYPD